MTKDGAKAPHSAPHDSDLQWREALLQATPGLRAFAGALSHNPADADDLVQDTLYKALRRKDRFAAGTNLRAWLFTILRNTFYSELARRRREVSDEQGQYAARLTTPPNQEWSVSLKAVRQALLELPHEYREALVLVGGAGLTYLEAAEICGCALGTIKSRVNRARARLLALTDGATAGEGGPPDQISSDR